jgi:DNA invertase Pin-like site-specific DNA recombinase
MRPDCGTSQNVPRAISSLTQPIVCSYEGPRHLAQATEQPINTSTAAGKCFLDMPGVFAEFETNLRRERQLEGIAPRRRQPAGFDRCDRSARDEAQGLGATAISRTLDIGRASVYRVLESGWRYRI